MKTKTRSRFLKYIWLFAGILFLALCTFVLLRYFVFSDTDETTEFMTVLQDALPLFIVWIVAFVGITIGYRVNVVAAAKNLSVKIKNTVKRYDEGTTLSNETGDFACAVTALKELDAEFSNRITMTERSVSDRTRKETYLAAALSMEEDVSAGTSSYRENHYGISAMVNRSQYACGDFYDYFFHNGRSVCFVVGDVWESGFSAVRFAAKVKELFRIHAQTSETLVEAVNAVNAALLTSNDEKLALTAFFGMFSPTTGELRYVNAGHYPPMLIGEQCRYLRMHAGEPLGLYEDCRVTEEYIILPKGNSLVLYTDGIPYARNQNGDGFGYEQLFSAAKKGWESALGAEAIVESIDNVMTEFCKQEQQTDDGVILALYYPRGLQKKFLPKTSELERLRDLLLDWLKDDVRKNKIFLACEEVFTNIVNHSGASVIQLDCQIEGENLIVRFLDDGEPFNPLQPQEGYRDFSNGGMGMAIIRQIAGEVHYRMQENRNVLTMRFPVMKGNR